MKKTYIPISDLYKYEGDTVHIRGWLEGKRSGGKVVFLQMRDGTGFCQCVVEAASKLIFEIAEHLTQESSVELAGKVRKDKRATGGYEIEVDSLELIQEAIDYPVTRKPHGIDFLMSNRHLWLRSKRQWTVLRIRHTLIKACRDFFDNNGFTLIDTPILTAGAGEDKQTLFPVDYFNEKAFLAQTGQLYLESACMAFNKVYCFGPTFRAEKSKTRRHLTEFWMVEPEIAFAQLDDVCLLAEKMILHMLEHVLDKHEDDLRFLNRDLAALKKVSAPFPVITYSQAAAMLKSEDTNRLINKDIKDSKAELEQSLPELENLEQRLANTSKASKRANLANQIHCLREKIHDLQEELENKPHHLELAKNFEWGADLGGSDETIISRQFEKPVFVTKYPACAKAFYMKQNPEDPKTVLNMDMLAPEGYGEIIGGSQREDNIDVLRSRMQEKKLNPDDYAWYLDLRKYGSVPHGGFGLGIERMLTWICGLKHVRETIPFPRTTGRIYP